MTRPESRLPGFAPKLAQVHPGYFKIVLSLLLVHAALAVDAFLINTSTSASFRIISDALGGQLWLLTVYHFLVFLLILAGLYVKGWFQLLRLGAALSAVVFNCMAVAFGYAAITRGISYFGAIAAVALSLSSIACAKEPEEGPGTSR